MQADFEWSLVHPDVLKPADAAELRTRTGLARDRLATVRHPQIPSAQELHLPLQPPAPATTAQPIGPGLSSPLLEEARILKVFPDFKYLSDLRWRPAVTLDHAAWTATLGASCNQPLDLEARRTALQAYIEHHYELPSPATEVDPELVAPRWHLAHPGAAMREAFDYVESHWAMLVRNATAPDGSTLIPSPYPTTVPAGRFRESYYWDSCLAIEGLLATGRTELARMQADNFLESIRQFGFVPNGQRHYYLSRSQPPLSAMLVRRVVEASAAEFARNGDKQRQFNLIRWVRDRALPLLEKELLEFWSDPATRYDAQLGLHRHWDDLVVKRPERHSCDDEEGLGAGLRDVRAMAESGLDFTAAFHGPSGRNEITGFTPLLLNSLLCKFAGDLLALAGFSQGGERKAFYADLLARKQQALAAHLWNPAVRAFRDYHPASGQHSPARAFSSFAPLYAQACAAGTASLVAADGLQLERAGGIAGSSLDDSPHQWDGSNGWAPAQMLAIDGLRHYGFHADARRIAGKWADSLARVHARCGLFIERIDVDTQDLPHHHEGQYPVQPGFLWTNASFAWALVDVLGCELKARTAPASARRAQQEDQT